MRPCLLFTVLAFKPACPGHEALKQLGNEFPGLVVDQVSVGVEPFRGIWDHNFRIIQRKHVQKDTALTQVILGPRRGTGTATC